MNPQNCAITMTLKMPTHRKNGTAIDIPSRPAAKNTARFEHEEQRDPANELNSIHPRGERAERGNKRQQQHRLSGRRVRFDRGAALGQDERLADGLQHVVGREHQEQVQPEQECLEDFVAMYLRDRAQHTSDEVSLPRRNGPSSHLEARRCTATSVGRSGVRSSPTSFHPSASRRK